MPNYCNYSMCVKGRKESLKEFIKVIQADYDYGTMEFSHDRHMFRVFEAEYDEVERLVNDIYQVVINGYCAWSVASCMLEGGYYQDFKERYGSAFRGTTLLIESKRLDIEIEVYSEEGGMCFQEHYIIGNGELALDECVDWHEYYIGEYETKEQAEADLEFTITDKEWNSGEEWISRGGFDNWDFEI